MNKSSVLNRLAWIVAITLCLTGIFLYTTESMDIKEPAKVTHIEAGYDVNGEFYISQSGPKLGSYKICGILDGAEPIKLSIVLQSVDGTKSYGANKVGERIAPGYFCSEIKVTNSLVFGNYRFVIYDRRYLISEIEFEITR